VAKAQQAAPPATTRLQPPPPFPQMLPQQQNNQQHQRRPSPPTAISTSTTVTTSIPSTSTMSTLLFQPNAHYDPKQQDKKTQLINVSKKGEITNALFRINHYTSLSSLAIPLGE
jgi:hypothetical protein